jgi:UDP-N-acetyl-D-glucosamine dehydrogenase
MLPVTSCVALGVGEPVKIPESAERFAAQHDLPLGIVLTGLRPSEKLHGALLPIDPSYLSWTIEQQLGTASRFVDMANDINNQMPAYVVRRVQLGLYERLKSVKGSRVLVLGLSYKKNSNARETPATGVIEGLLELGAPVHVHDDHASPNALDALASRVALTPDELQAADAVVLVTDHDDVDYDLVVSDAAYVLGTRNRLRAPNVEPL